jgi:hypothetical protein
VIHRDLKPANIFIARSLEEEIKVLDFGVAQLRDATSERTATGTALGTPAYMSPEQAMGLVDQLDGRADLFSVGAMMHALVTGQRINNGRTEQEALVMAATKPVPSVARNQPNLPVEIVRIIDKALAWDRRNRFQDAREMQHALLEAMPGHGVVPFENRPPPRPLEVVPGLASPPPPQSREVLASRQAVSNARASSPELSAVVEPPPSSLAVGPVALDAAPIDPQVQVVRDLTKHFDKVLASARQFGWTHPSTERSLRTTHDALAEFLSPERDALTFAVRPYSFTFLGHPVWEPSTPFDVVPYNLFACGMRTFTFERGVALDPLRQVFALWAVDPSRDLPPEDDIAAVFWEKALPNVRYEVVDAFAEGDASEREAFYGEADVLEALASRAAHHQADRLEAHAMALTTDDSALRCVREVSLFALDTTTRAVLRPELESVPSAIWAERYTDALVEGYLDTAANRDATIVLASLRKSVADLGAKGRVDGMLRLWRTARERLQLRVEGEENQLKLAGALTRAMYGADNLELVLRHFRQAPSHPPADLDVLASLLAFLGAGELPPVLASLRETTHRELRGVLLRFVERFVDGNESAVAAALAGAEPDTIAALLSLLSRSSTPQAQQLVRDLASSEDATVRVEANVMMASSADAAFLALAGFIDDASPLVRLAALRAIVRYQARSAWPAVMKATQAKGFYDLGMDERRELLRTLILTGAERGEAAALEVAKKGSVLASEGRESTRSLAAALLGEFSRSPQVAAALRELGQARWGVSEETRTAAAGASARITQRIAESASGGASS